MAVHIKNLKIDSYRGIKNLELSNLADINVLTGDNNTWKTSILEVLRSLNSPTEIESWHSSMRLPESIITLNNLSFFESTLLLFNVNKRYIKYNFDIKEINTEIFIKYQEEEVEISKKEIDKISGVIFRNKKNDSEELIPVKKLKLSFYKNGNLSNEKDIYEVSRRRILRKKEDNNFFLQYMFLLSNI